MATLVITKVSGVIFIQQSGTTNPKSYFGYTGQFQASDDNLSIRIKIGTVGQVKMDEYDVALGDLTVGTSTPSTISSAKVLLNAIFGT